MRFRPTLLCVAGIVSTGSLSILACVGDDPGPVAAGGSSGSGDAAADARVSYSDSGGSDPSDAGAPRFCVRKEATGAAFCADFEESSGVSDGWSATGVDHGATITLNDAFGFESARSAKVKLADTDNLSRAALSKTISYGAPLTKVSVDCDVYFHFPSWPADAIDDFIVVTTAAADGGSPWYFGLRRDASWKTIAQMGATSTSTTIADGITPDAWHHVSMAYDASGVGAAIQVTVDGTVASTLSLQKGDGGAPITFDEVTLIAGAANRAPPGTATEATLDNVVVRVQ